jgi:hypothetical protein
MRKEQARMNRIKRSALPDLCLGSLGQARVALISDKAQASFESEQGQGAC